MNMLRGRPVEQYGNIDEQTRIGARNSVRARSFLATTAVTIDWRSTREAVATTTYEGFGWGPPSS